MRVRGLKLPTAASHLCAEVSHPMRVRGLKHQIFCISRWNGFVAPHAGASGLRGAVGGLC